MSSRADAGGPVNGIRKAVATQTPNLTAAGTWRQGLHRAGSSDVRGEAAPSRKDRDGQKTVCLDQSGAALHSVRPFSRPRARAERRETAGLSAYSPGTNCRDRLAAGGKWIRTLGPAKVTCLKRGLYITGSSSTSTRALPPAERGAARFGGGDGSEHLLWRRIRDAAACLAG